MTTQELQFDRTLLGKEFPAGTFRVDKERILAYCEAIGETNPIHVDEEAARRGGFRSLVAPPTFCNLLERTSVRPNIRLKFPGTGFHQWQTVECHVAIQAGDVLAAKVRLKDVYTKPSRMGVSAVVVWETTFTNQEGTMVASVEGSFLRRSQRPDGAA